MISPPYHAKPEYCDRIKAKKAHGRYLDETKKKLVAMLKQLQEKRNKNFFILTIYIKWNGLARKCNFREKNGKLKVIPKPTTFSSTLLELAMAATNSLAAIYE